MPASEEISPELNDLFVALNNEVTWLHTIWELLNQLYWSGAENFEIMDATAPHFFAVVRTILFEEMVMIVNRLTDPATTLGRPNASLDRLIEQINEETHPKLVSALREKIKSIRTNSHAFRTWRNKSISHNDLSATLGRDDPLPNIMRGEAKNVIAEIAEFMNEFSLRIMDTSQSYQPFLVAHGDGIALMKYLKQAIS